MAHVARGAYFDLRPLNFCPILARPSSSPGNYRCRLAGCGPQLAGRRTKKFLLQAVGASSISSLRTVVAELGRGELGVGGKAHYGGASDRTQVRTRVNARAWQGLQRRLKPHRHAHHLNAPQSNAGEIGPGQLEKVRCLQPRPEPTCVSSRLLVFRLWLVSICGSGQYRVRLRSGGLSRCSTHQAQAPWGVAHATPRTCQPEPSSLPPPSACMRASVCVVGWFGVSIPH